MPEGAITFEGRWAKDSAVPSLLPLRVRGLEFKALGVTIIDGIDMDIASGGCTVIMGHNGAGKSVLLRLLHGLLKPSAGTIRWAVDLREAELRRRQAMVF
jgi:tungstate transport system ATP-binding protein